MVDIGGINPGMAGALQDFSGNDAAREIYQKCNDYCRQVDRQMEHHQLDKLQETLQRIKATLSNLGLTGVAVEGQNVDMAISAIRQLTTRLDNILRDPTVSLTGQQMNQLEQTREQLGRVLSQLTNG